MKIVQRQIADLIPAEYNPRQISEKQLADLAKSMENLGTLEPAVVNQYPGRENVIISGHQRIRVAQDMGMDKYPCLEVKFPPEKEREANIRMNRNTGEWDWDLLESGFEVEDLVGWGFDTKDLPNFKPSDDDDQPRLDKLSEKIISCPNCGKEFDANAQT